MKILVITQVYWPDTASTAQHLADLSETLAEKGHQLNVITSRFTYEKGERISPKKEVRNRVNIFRIKQTYFKKATIIGRLINFASFNFNLFFHIIMIPRSKYDLILGMTSPPLISFFGTIIAKWKKIKFCYWTMDLQPELAIASNLIKASSFSAKWLSFLGDYVFKRADLIIALDRFMKKHIQSRIEIDKKIDVIPVWPVMNEIYNGDRLLNPFRIAHQFEDRIIVMYSGNHSFVHPLDTLLNAILQLKDDPRFLFVFIGGGVRKKEVTLFQASHRLNNILQLPYQPRNQIHLSLGAADLQVVILGDGQVGYTHPNKVYGAMFIGKPILYIGPKESHVMDILNQCPENIAVQHHEADKIVAQLHSFAEKGEDQWKKIGQQNALFAEQTFHPKVIKAQMVKSIESI